MTGVFDECNTQGYSVGQLAQANGYWNQCFPNLDPTSELGRHMQGEVLQWVEAPDNPTVGEGAHRHEIPVNRPVLVKDGLSEGVLLSPTKSGTFHVKDLSVLGISHSVQCLILIKGGQWDHPGVTGMIACDTDSPEGLAFFGRDDSLTDCVLPAGCEVLWDSREGGEGAT